MHSAESPNTGPDQLVSDFDGTLTRSRGRPALPAYRYPPTEPPMWILVVDKWVGCGQPVRLWTTPVAARLAVGGVP